MDAPVPVLRLQEKLLIDLSNTPELTRTASTKPSGGQVRGWWSCGDGFFALSVQLDYSLAVKENSVKRALFFLLQYLLYVALDKCMLSE